MSQGPEVPRAFRFVFRLTATAIIVGLVCGLLTDVYGVRWLMPVALLATLAGPPAFLLSVWFGALEGWVRVLDAILYTLILVGCFLAFFIFSPGID
jgi:hypothetical protein